MYFKKILLAVALIGLAIAAYFAYFIYGVMLQPNTKFEKSQVFITIPSDASYQKVRETLTPYLKDMDGFDALAARKKYNQNIKAGRFAIKKDMSNNDIINTMRSTNIPLQLAFNNQETLEKLAGRIGDQIEADSLSLLNSFKDKTFLKENAFTKATALGMYIPNSYEFFWNTSAESFRDRMLKEYNRFWNSSRVAKAQNIGLSPKEVMTLASIVQKETAKVDERPRVAGVYVNRLNRRIPLQADPTVIYAIKEQTNDFDKVIKRVLYKDLEIDSPYNTYKYPGLPPGPIAMPDITSIDGVLNYEKHDYLYFVVNVDNFGYHKFAKTLSQHNANKKKYVDWINKKGINR